MDMTATILKKFCAVEHAWNKLEKEIKNEISRCRLKLQRFALISSTISNSIEDAAETMPHKQQLFHRLKLIKAARYSLVGLVCKAGKYVLGIRPPNRVTHVANLNMLKKNLVESRQQISKHLAAVQRTIGNIFFKNVEMADPLEVDALQAEVAMLQEKLRASHKIAEAKDKIVEAKNETLRGY